MYKSIWDGVSSLHFGYMTLKEVQYNESEQDYIYQAVYLRYSKPK